jgi:hypothetical protein
MDGSAAKMRNVVLMGTSHKHQLPGNTSEVAFRDFVEQICDVFKVRAIAELLRRGAMTTKRNTRQNPRIRDLLRFSAAHVDGSFLMSRSTGWAGAESSRNLANVGWRGRPGRTMLRLSISHLAQRRH